MRILLIGGSKSGKSTMGQRLTRAFAAGAPMYYWATMEPTDEEDLARIARHLKDREGWGFETIERGRDLLPALERIDPAGAVLFDSITAQLACEMFGETIDKTAPARAGEEQTISGAAADASTSGRSCTARGWRRSAADSRRSSTSSAK